MRLPQSIGKIHSIRITCLAVLAIVTTVSAAAAQQLVSSPSSLKFGTVIVGQSEAQLVVLSNTGATSVAVSAATANDAQFSVSGANLPINLAPGQSVTLTIVFKPASTSWTGSKVIFSSNASNSSLPILVFGSGVTSEPLTASPTALSFGQLAVGATVTLPVVLTNTNSWKDTVKTFQISGTGYSVSGPSLPLILGPGQSATLGITFKPQATGLTGGSLFISGAGVALNVPLTGTGTTIGQLSLSPAALNFGSTEVGVPSVQTLVMSAATGSVTVNSAASSNSQFAIPGVSFPLTINAGQSVQINVTFTPTTAGAISGTLSFKSTATNQQSSESVSGTGTLPYVSLSWSESNSQQVAGYNVYRGTTPGVYSRINSALDPSSNYTDSTVARGTTYYYAATAVSTNGQESLYSTPVEVVVP